MKKKKKDIQNKNSTKGEKGKATKRKGKVILDMC